MPTLTHLMTATLAIVALPAFAQEMPPPPVPADPPAPAPITPHANERSFWEQESRLVKQLRLMELHAAIADAQRKAEGERSDSHRGRDAVNLPALAPPLIRSGSTLPDAAPMLNLLPAPAPSVRQPTNPVAVVGIWGIEGHHTADVLNNGMRIAVREGDALPDGWTVHSIRRTGIVITKGNRRETLVVATALGD